MVFRQKRGGHTRTQGRTHTNQEQERGWVGVRTANANAWVAVEGRRRLSGGLRQTGSKHPRGGMECKQEETRQPI
jgi:hypothetical protein